MKRRGAMDIGAAAAGGLIAAAAAILICVVLASLAKPERFRARVAALDQLARRTEKLDGKLGDPHAYPPKAICDSPSAASSEDLKKRVTALASLAGVTLSNVTAGAPPVADQAELTPIKLQFSVSGHYDSILLMMDALSKAQPVFFVDTVDIKSEASSADLKITGNIYCWTSDHP